MSDQATNTPAGWYDDPTAAGMQRYWNGSAWTQNMRSTVTADAASTIGDSGPVPFAQQQTASHAIGFSPGHEAPAPAQTVGFFKSLFDLSFSDFVTLKFAKFIYILGIVIAIINWIGGTLVLFIMAAAAGSMMSYDYGSSDGGFSFLFPVLSLFFGWIPALINIVVLRVVLEFVVATIRTAQNTTELARAAK